MPVSDTLSLVFTSARVIITAARLDSADFVDSVFADSAKIVELGFGTLEGAKLRVGLAPGQRIRARAKFGFAFLQYLTDDRPAPDLPFRYRTDWVRLPTSSSILRMPTFANPEEGAPSLQQLLGHRDYEAMETTLGQRFFKPLRRQSLALQRGYYQRLLADSTIAACCPEYIAQAREFLRTDTTKFRTIADLHLELYHRDTVLRLEIWSGQRLDATLVLLIVPEDR